jgi:hypothetical protein
MKPCLDSDSWASSIVPAVVSRTSTGTLSEVQHVAQGAANCAWKQQDEVSIPRKKQNVSVSEGLATQFLQKSIPELEPEPIPSYSIDLDDIMDRDATTLDKDVLSFLARCA